MRVLMLVHNRAYVGGGTFYRALHLGSELIRRGAQVTLLASAPERFPASAPPTATPVPELVTFSGVLPARWRYGYDFIEAAQRVAWVRAHPRWDIVHAFDSRPTVIYPALAAQKRGARLVMDWGDWFGRGGAVEERANPWLRAVLRPLETFYEEHYRLRADAATVITSALGQRLEGLGYPRGRVLALRNGTYPERFRPLSVLAARRRLGLPEEKLLAGYLGSLFPADAALLAQAMQQVQSKLGNSGLVLIGEPKSAVPPVVPVWRSGFVPQAMLDVWLCACDVLVLPLSDSTANRGRWPSKLGDYFSAGRPVAACDVGDVGTVLGESGAGLCSAPNAEALAEVLVRLFGDAALRAKMGAAGRQAAEGAFHWRTLGQQLADFYQERLHA